MTLLGELTFEEAAALCARGPVVLLPVGAVEAHGPHLPLAADCVIAEEMARRSAAALDERAFPSAIAPTVAYSCAEYAAGFAGTVSVEAAGFEAYLLGALSGLQRTGFARVCLVNAHLEPRHLEAVRAVLARLERKVAFPDVTDKRWARLLHGGPARRFDGHAGVYETSLVLAARPDSVREQLRAALPEVPVNLARAIEDGAKSFEQAGGPRAYFGAPARASRAIGEELFRILVEMVLIACGQLWPETGLAAGLATPPEA
ncbi:MAG TPA: creatininase family protein [Polyangia bacterium]|nr:creatininase family protein [Polyangia bacterium]